MSPASVLDSILEGVRADVAAREALISLSEVKAAAASPEEASDRLRDVKRRVTSAISQCHSLRVADVVLVSQGAIPITTSGKIRRSTCLDRYRLDDFARLDETV